MDLRRAKRRSILLMAACSLMWSTGGILIKMVPWNSFVIAGFRSLISAGIVACYMKWKKVPFRVNRASIVSGVMLACAFLSFVTANKMTTAANAIVLQFTSPVFIVIISTVIYRQRFGRTDYAVVGLTLAGVSLFFFDKLAPGYLGGNGLAVLSGFFLGAMFAVTGNTDPSSRMTGIFLGQAFTALVGIPVSFFIPTRVDAVSVGCILLLGVVQLGVPYILYGIAVEHCPPLVCCLVSALEPLLNPVWVFLLDGERPGVFALMGGAIVIGTVTVWNLWLDRRGAPGREEPEEPRAVT